MKYAYIGDPSDDYAGGRRIVQYGIKWTYMVPREIPKDAPPGTEDLVKGHHHFADESEYKKIQEKLAAEEADLAAEDDFDDDDAPPKPTGPTEYNSKKPGELASELASRDIEFKSDATKAQMVDLLMADDVKKATAEH